MCRSSSSLLFWQSCSCLPADCPGLHLLYCFSSSLLPRAGCLGPDKERRKRNCARQLQLCLHSALMQAVARGCMSGLLHASITLNCSPLKSFLPRAKGTAAACVKWWGGYWLGSSSTHFVASRFEKMSNFLEQLPRLSAWNGIFRGVAEIAGISVSSGFYCSPSLYGNRCFQMLTAFLSCLSPLP